MHKVSRVEAVEGVEAKKIVFTRKGFPRRKDGFLPLLPLLPLLPIHLHLQTILHGGHKDLPQASCQHGTR